MVASTNYTPQDMEEFQRLIDKYRYDFVSLAYILFPFGQEGTDLEHMDLYDWQIEELQKLSAHLANPATRYETYRLIVSSGNGAAKTALGAIIFFCLMFTQRVKGRITANTDPQMKSIVWPEYDLWFNRCRYANVFFEKFGTSIKARAPQVAEIWRLDTITWSETTPAAISGLHNKGGCAIYIFEEAPGIPGVIWKYAAGAFTETETIKIHLAFGNSDDPESQFEQNMESPLWHARRIDTRSLKHIDPKQIDAWLVENNGDEDADDFRVRVRGLPRKTSRDSIIRLENVEAAIARAKGFDKRTVSNLPVILSVDPAWTGGDETTIWYQQGNYRCCLAKYKLDKEANETHQVTYDLLQKFDRELGADKVLIDQGEGTTLYTLAMNDGKTHYELVSFANSPNDQPDPKDSTYGNIRAQMYYEANQWLRTEGVLDSLDPAWMEDIKRQLCWTKGTRHKKTNKKMCESKQEIKDRVMKSPDLADGFVLLGARKVYERLPENQVGGTQDGHPMENVIGGGAFIIKSPQSADYDSFEENYKRMYD